MKKSLMFLLAWLLFLCGCHNESIKEEIIPEMPNLELDVDAANLFLQEGNIIKNAPNKSNNKLAFDLYNELKDIENITYSPFSISLALAMTYAGSNGETQNAMKKVLGFGDNVIDFHKSYGEFASILSKKDRTLNDTNIKISNVQWLQNGYNILDSYKDLLKDAYLAKPIELDFKTNPSKATKIINQSIANATKDEIKELLKDDLSSDTRLVLTNAIYFNSKWANEFDEDRTQNGDFTKKDGSTTSVSYMKQTDYFPYSEDDDKQVLQLPYKDKEFAALIVLPKVGKTLELAGFDGMINKLETKKVNLWLPKFSQRTEPKIKEILIKKGLGDLFDPTKADLSKITGNKDLYVFDIAHEAVVKMYEGGTTAAAATAVIIVQESAMAPQEDEEPVIFHATRPFMFFIAHKPTGTILFMGRKD